MKDQLKIIVSNALNRKRAARGEVFYCQVVRLLMFYFSCALKSILARFRILGAGGWIGGADFAVRRVIHISTGLIIIRSF